MFLEMQVRKTLALGSALLISFVSDMGFTLSNIKHVIPGYVVIFLYGLSTIGLEHTQSVISPSLGAKATSMSSILGATVIGLPFYLFKALVVRIPYPI